MDDILLSYKSYNEAYKNNTLKYKNDFDNNILSKDEYTKLINNEDNNFKAFLGQNFASIKNYIFEKLDFIINLYVTIKEYNAQMQVFDSTVVMNDKEFLEFNEKLTYKIKNSTLNKEIIDNLFLLQDMIKIYHTLLLKSAMPRNEVIHKETEIGIKKTSKEEKESKKEVKKAKSWLKFLPTIIILVLLLIAYLIYNAA